MEETGITQQTMWLIFSKKKVPIVLAELEKSGKSGYSGSIGICVGSCLSSPSESKKKYV